MALQESTFASPAMELLRIWAAGLARLALAVLVGLVLHAVLFRVLRPLARRTRWAIDDVLARRLRRPSRWVVVLFAVHVGSFALALPADGASGLRHGVSLAILAAFTWLVLALLVVIQESIEGRYDVTVADNLEARRVHTQVGVLMRTLHVFVIVIAVGVGLMTFPRIRELGTSLLASAGIAGLAIGLAARPVLENLIAGLQIALTQPIRLDDVVIVEGEWGRIEEITSTYVVVRIWDERRLIVPFSRFIQQAFQNWTRTSSQLLGTVTLQTDYSVPVDEVRTEMRRIVEASEKWDGRVCVLQVTDTTERTMQLRALISAKDSGSAWDLRVLLREKLLDWLRREHPEALPRSRVDLTGTPAAGA